jgi:TolB protein
MLVRAFRVTDRLSNAVLRIGAWSAMVMVNQATHLKSGLLGILATLWALTAGTVLTTTAVARQTSQTAQGLSQEVATRRQQRMAQRAAEAELKPTVIKDPLLAQNRALSGFAVLLLLILLAVVVLQNTDDKNNPLPAGGGGRWPDARSTAPATAIFPTAIPTATPVPDPLRVGGSVTYTLRENGQEDIWAIAVGESSPLRLTNSPADERDPAWSPDGTKIAFASNRDGNWELYIMQVDTGEITRLTYTPGFEGAPTWSPDMAWLAYEGYYPETEDLEIYVISTDPARAASLGAQRATYTSGPDIEPDWGPGGRHIAFTSWRTGNQDIFILSLDEGDSLAVNLTNTPDINEDYPAWSHDGASIAYSANVQGVEGVWIRPAQQLNTTPILIGKGRMPAWAPNNGSVIYTLDYGQQSQLLAGTIGQFGAATDAIALSNLATDPHWTQATLPGPLVASGGLPPSENTAQPLYIENVQEQASQLYGMALLDTVTAPQPYLSDRVNDSFEALRRRTLNKVGYDFLGTLEEAFWFQDRPVDPGEPRQNWHYTGRAFSINRNLVLAGLPAPIEVVREDIEVNTYWRVYVRVADAAQNGALGEPLRRMPWDFAARSSGDVEDYERGGRLKDRIPTGYYVDLTQMADDFGWKHLPAQRTWQYNFAAIQYWEFVKFDGLSWDAAMLELYTQEDFQNFMSEATRVPAPPPLPTVSPTPEVFRSPTPPPPDLQQ